jgi:UDP-N-acetyl-D-mannosaminuronate dehydrogenase
VYESTVYPGVTEEICGPLLERVSGLRCGVDFKLAYSPERIVPGEGLVYIAYAEGVHGSKLTTAALEKKLGVATTARTPETIRKLLA